MNELGQVRLDELLETIKNFMDREAKKGADARWAWSKDHPKWKEMISELKDELEMIIQ